MLSSLPRPSLAASMVSSNPFFTHDNWTKDGQVVVQQIGSSLLASKGRMSGNETSSLKKRESRSGTRKVSALSADQLERKRANDREAQRSIRQRTKEHIEQLENQVSSLQMQVADLRRNDRFEDLMRRNASLEDEVGRLKHQLTTVTGRPNYSTEQPGAYRSGWPIEEGSSNAAPSMPPMLSTPFSGSSQHAANVPRAPSALSASSRSSHPHDWPQYPNTRSPSLGASSDTDFSASYMIDGQLHQPSRLVSSSISVANPQLSFSNTTSPTQPPSEPGFAHVYPVNQPHRGQQSDDQTNQFLPSQRSMPMSIPSVTAAAQPPATQSYQPTSPFQNSLTASPQRDAGFSYPWVPQA